MAPVASSMPPPFPLLPHLHGSSAMQLLHCRFACMAAGLGKPPAGAAPKWQPALQPPSPPHPTRCGCAYPRRCWSRATLFWMPRRSPLTALCACSNTS
eukprot:334994-Chlamydomonas_euryale.AAC.2